MPTKIEWADETWQVVTGCDVLSPGCTNCYAMRLAGTRLKHHPTRQGLTTMSKAGPVWTGEVRFNGDLLDQPLRWRRPRRIFVAAHGDLFYEAVPDAVIDKVFAVMALCPQHSFQVLTKRAARMREYLTTAGIGMRHLRAAAGLGLAPPGWQEQNQNPDTASAHLPLPNVWLGVSVEDQTRADERIPLLLDTPAAVRWISAEPLLGPINPWHIGILRRAAELRGVDFRSVEGLDWVVAGGESRQNKPGRPMHPDWPRSLRDQCTAAGVAFNFKQWGDWAPTKCEPGGDLGGDMRRGLVEFVKPRGEPDGHFRKGDALMRRIGTKKAGRLLDGRTWDEFPDGARRAATGRPIEDQPSAPGASPALHEDGDV